MKPLPKEVAAQVARSLLGPQDPPTFEAFFSALRKYEQVRFDVPDLPDTDGFLFQYGTVTLLDESVFTVGAVRQLETFDDGHEHASHCQVLMEYRYYASLDLRVWGSHASWWFRGGPTPFGDWLDQVRFHPVWGMVRGRFPLGFDVLQDTV